MPLEGIGRSRQPGGDAKASAGQIDAPSVALGGLPAQNRTVLLAALVLVLGSLVAWWLLAGNPDGLGYDWAILRGAALRLRLGDPLYLDPTGARFWPGNASLYYGPPAYAVVALPISFVSDVAARRLALVVGVGLGLVSVALLVAPVRSRISGRGLSLLVLGVLGAGAFIVGLIVSASSLLVLLLLAGVWTGLVRRSPVIVGVCLGTATAFRVYPAALFLALLVARRWRELFASVATVAFWIVVGILVAGPSATEQYVRLLVNLSRVSAPNASTLVNLLADLGMPRGLLWAPRISSLVAGIAMLFAAGQRLGRMGSGMVLDESERAKLLVTLGLAIAGMLFASPLVWDHYLTALLVLVVGMMALTGRARWGLAPILFLPGWLGAIGLVLVPVAAAAQLVRRAPAHRPGE